MPSQALTRVLHSLDNQLTDDELWEKIHGEVTTLGLESAILVTRKTSPRGNVKPSAHVQFKVCPETVLRSPVRH